MYMPECLSFVITKYDGREGFIGKRGIVFMRKEQKRIVERNRFFNFMKKYGADILESPNFRNSENNIQHGNMSVRRHSINVALCSFVIARALRIHCHKQDLLRGALLHDYFQYDWHSREHRDISNLHGFYHPGIALRNAEKEYQLTDRQKDIIKKHMWPLTVVPPTCREAWIVTMADKYCSLMETFHFHQGKSIRTKKKLRKDEQRKLQFIPKIRRAL